MVSVFLIIIILIIIGAAIFKIAAICSNKVENREECRNDEAEVGGLMTGTIMFGNPARIIRELEQEDPPYPLSDPEGMPAPPQGYLTSNIPISAVTLSDIPPTRRTTRRVQEEDTTNSSELPPSYSEVMRNT